MHGKIYSVRFEMSENYLNSSWKYSYITSTIIENGFPDRFILTFVPWRQLHVGVLNSINVHCIQSISTSLEVTHIWMFALLPGYVNSEY